MKYYLITAVLSSILFAVSFVILFSDIFKATGFAISKVAQSQTLIKGIDYNIVNTYEKGNDMLVIIKMYGNYSNGLCIKQIKVNNISKKFDCKELSENLFEITIKDCRICRNVVIRLCNGEIIKERKL